MDTHLTPAAPEQDLSRPEPFFRLHNQVAVAFSGGVDSAYVLRVAATHCHRVMAYFARTPFQPAFELEDARRLCRELKVELRVLELPMPENGPVVENAPDRCYHCKKRIFTAIIQAAREDGFQVVLDGTNASDDGGDRPGMRALEELRVLSPLRLWGMTKGQVREQSRDLGLFTWNKPSYACLATRIPTGQRITQERLDRVERSEALLSRMGFTDFRVRETLNGAKIQVPASQMEMVIAHRQKILEELGKDYDFVVLDLEPRPEEWNQESRGESRGPGETGGNNQE